MEVDIIITLAIAAGLIFAMAQVSRIIRTSAMHKTLRQSIEKGHPLDPKLIEGLDRNAEPGAADQRIGLVLIAIALALFAAGALNGGGDSFTELAQIALFPLFVGAALLLRLRWAKRAE